MRGEAEGAWEGRPRKDAEGKAHLVGLCTPRALGRLGLALCSEQLGVAQREGLLCGGIISSLRLEGRLPVGGDEDVIRRR